MSSFVRASYRIRGRSKQKVNLDWVICSECGARVKQDNYTKHLRKHHKAKQKKKRDAVKVKHKANKRGYPKQWKKHRKRVLETEHGKRCFLCGKTREQEIEDTGKDLHVHHIDGNKRNCSDGNLLTLCGICHSREIHDYQKGRGWVRYPKRRTIDKMKGCGMFDEQRQENFENEIEAEYAKLHGDPCAFLEAVL